MEEVFGALSLVLNDGGLAQLHVITTELNAALAGNEPQIRSLLGQLATLIGNLNDHRRDIVSALDGLDALSATLAARNRQIGHVLDHITPAWRCLPSSAPNWSRCSTRCTGSAASRCTRSTPARPTSPPTCGRSTPILRELADAGQNLPLALQVLLTYPFTDQVLKDIKGDYLNAYLSVQAAPGTTVIAPVGPHPAATPTPTAGSQGGGH